MAGGNTITGDMHKQRVAGAISALGVTARAVKYRTVYGGQKSAHAFTFDGERCLVVSVWQGVNGTVDEKYPFLFENVTHIDGYPTVFLVIGGEGASAGASRWLEGAVRRWDGRSPKVILCDSADDFRGILQRWKAHPDSGLISAVR